MNCSECGKKIKNRPRWRHRQTGERVCRDCLNDCYHSEAYLQSGTDPEAAAGVLTCKDGGGAIKLRCGIKLFIERLYDLEERYKPEIRFTKKDTETGRIKCRTALEAMIQRLYEYEHPPRCAVCGKPVERVRPCEYYRRRREVTCDDCCERCYNSDPFQCLDHEARVREDLEE